MIADGSVISSVSLGAGDSLVDLVVQIPDNRVDATSNCSTLQFRIAVQSGDGEYLTGIGVELIQRDDDEAGFLVLSAPGVAPIDASSGLPAGLQLRSDSRVPLNQTFITMLLAAD